MSKIRIKYFGPIQQGMDGDGWIEIKKVSLFIGNQGSGKSCIAKLVSIFSWMEKALIRGDFQPKQFTDSDKFRNTYCAYHRLEHYFFNEQGHDTAQIGYIGQEYEFAYSNGGLSINRLPTAPGELTQVMYIPAERNLVSAARNPKQFRDFSPSLINFVGEFETAKQAIKGTVSLPINGVQLEYDLHNDTLNIKGNGYKVRLAESSSGFQATVPLFLVSKYYAELVLQQSASGNNSMSAEEKERFRKDVSQLWSVSELSEEQKRAAISALAKKFNKSAFVNIVEEPEQNLFPSSQKEMLYALLAFNNKNSGNKLVVTSHSPYIVNYLTVAIQAEYLHTRLQQAGRNDLLERLQTHVPTESLVPADQVAIYELDEQMGTVKALPCNYGIPSDNNLLNRSIRDGNELFDQLLEIEELL